MAFRELASVDGSISPTPEARIPVADDGLLRGDGIFEVMRLYEGRPFALVEHLDRLERSGAAIALDPQRGAVEAEIEALLAELGDYDGQLRIVITRAGRRVLLSEPLPPMPDTIRVASVTYSPNLILNGVKSISYGANMQATRAAQSEGADEAILVNPEGMVLEAPTSTVFWVSIEGDLRTPSLDLGILESITRARIVSALPVEEGAFPLSDLSDSSEAFLASTSREVQAISAVNGRELAEVPGARTRSAAAAFAEMIDRELQSDRAAAGSR
jgi:branched-chain amino acid aminotransferase